LVKVKILPDGPPLSEFLGKLVIVEEERDGWLCKCPAHDDTRASLRVTVSAASGKVLIKCRVGCEAPKVMRAVKLTTKDLASMVADVMPSRPASSTEALPDAPVIADLAVKLDGYASTLHTQTGAPALAYAAQRFGIEPDDARRLGLGYAVNLGGGPRLVVPFRDLSGHALGFQARALNNVAQVRWAGPPNPDGASWARVGYFPGNSGWPEVIITEGPGDALTAVAAGYDAIGIRGAGLASSDATVDALADMLQDRTAIVAGDGDMAGRQFSAVLAEALIERGVTTKVLPMPDGKDITDWRADDPAWFRQGFVKAVKELSPTTADQAGLASWDEDTYSLSDVGAARYLRDYLNAQGKSIRYTGATGFLQLENGIWTKRADAQLRTSAHLVGDHLRKLADRAIAEARRSKAKADVDRANRFVSYRDHAQSSRGVDALLKELRSVAGVHADIDDFDRHPYFLAARNGVIDLRTGELQPHDPALLLTRRIDHDYDPHAPAIRWGQFLEEVFPDQPEMPAYIQRLVGYGVTGATDEQCFVVLYGTGSNGKSLFTDTLTEVFEPITTTTPFSTFEARRGDGVPNDLAALAGARLVMAPEGNQGRLMDEALLKRTTGRDRIAARFLRREFFTARRSKARMKACGAGSSSSSGAGTSAQTSATHG
jgi:putative DNA primase/helicase